MLQVAVRQGRTWQHCFFCLVTSAFAESVCGMVWYVSLFSWSVGFCCCKGTKKTCLVQIKHRPGGILISDIVDNQQLAWRPSRLVPTLTRARLLHTGLPFADTRHTQTKKFHFLRHEHAEFRGETCRFSTRKTGFFDPQHAMFQNPKSPVSRVPTGFAAIFITAAHSGCRRVSVVFIPARSAQAHVFIR